MTIFSLEYTFQTLKYFPQQVCKLRSPVIDERLGHGLSDPLWDQSWARDLEKRTTRLAEFGSHPTDNVARFYWWENRALDDHSANNSDNTTVLERLRTQQYLMGSSEVKLRWDGIYL